MIGAVIVGAGLFGSIIAATLRQLGLQVVVVDDGRPASGSLPAACLMKPSWFSSLGSQVHVPALKLLDQLYGVHELRFRVGLGHATVNWCDPAKILQPADKQATVRRIVAAGKKHWDVWLKEDEEPLRTPLVILAAGIWSTLLAPVDGGLRGLAGMAFLWPKKQIDAPFVKLWAPYRQLVAFNRGDGLWVGDGTAIKADNWRQSHELSSYQRCAKAVELINTSPTQLFGIRPYTKYKPCYLRQVKPNFWVATGGAKNGTIAAGWCAHEIARKMV